MALKDKTSLYDLVGDGPVGNMLTQQGQPFNLGMDSEFHAGPDGPNPNPTSLTEVYSKAITENNSFLAPQGGNPVSQDLDGLTGPVFNLGLDSIFHAGPDGPNPTGTSLLSVYSKTIAGNFSFTAPQSGNPVDQDLNGGLPSTGRYENNGPDGGYY